MQLVDLTDQQLGMLRVLGRVARPEGAEGYHKSSWWACRCRCGREVIKPRSYLLKAAEPHCGCMSEEIRRNTGKRSAASRVARAKAGQPERYNAEVELHIATYRLTRTCPQCGKPFDTLSNEWGWKYSGLYFCRWNCLRAYERAAAARKKRPYKSVK